MKSRKRLWMILTSKLCDWFYRVLPWNYLTRIPLWFHQIDQKVMGLPESVLFEYVIVSIGLIEEFALFAFERWLESFSAGILAQTCLRFFDARRETNPRIIALPGIEVVCDQPKPHKGIITHCVTCKFCGNVGYQHVVDITSNSGHGSSQFPKNVADHGADSEFI